MSNLAFILHWHLLFYCLFISIFNTIEIAMFALIILGTNENNLKKPYD